MPAFSVIPSLLQVNEGESFTTAITTDLKAGTKVYYKLVGKGVTTTDFTSGGVSGSIAVGSDGTASILHKLKEDKATEGDESFSIQIFSDKKMKNLAGQSDVMKVVDTSIKAAKPPKSGEGTGGIPQVKLPTYAVDSTKALTAYDSYTGATFASDVVYDINSENFRRWKENAIANSDDPQYLDEIIGWWAKAEMTDDTYVTTNMITTKSSSPYGPAKFYVERMVWDLDPTTTKTIRGESSTFVINNLYQNGVARAEGRALTYGEFLDYRTLDPSNYLPTSFPPGGDKKRSFTTIKGGFGDYSTDKKDENFFRSYVNGRIFEAGWYLNPFGNNLL